MKQTGGSSSTPTMTLMDHIRELQKRFFAVAIVLVAGASLAYVFRDSIIDILLSPLDGQKLIYLSPAGGFSFIFLVSIYVGLAVSAPVFIHQLYCFIRPLLPKGIQRYSLRIFASSLVLLACGIAFGYFIAVPGALNFLYEFAETYVEASLTAESYLNFIVAYTIGLGLVFQLPLVLLLIHWIKPLSPGGLLKSERWIIVLAFVAAAIITPTPDPLNQSMVALPIVIIYQLGVVAVLLNIRSTSKQLRRQQAAGSNHAKQPSTTVTVAKEATPQARAMSPLHTAKHAQHTRQPHHQPRSASLDGIIIKPRPQHGTGVHAPSRPPAATAPERVAPRRPYRVGVYMDGVSPIVTA